MKRACLVGWLAASAGCVTGSYQRAMVDEPIPEARLQALQIGVDDLGSCLAALGAPHRVFEVQVGENLDAGMALLWVWRDTAGFGVQVSVAMRDASVSWSGDYAAAELPGCMLWFDPDLRLQGWQRGTLGDLLPRRRRPAPATAG